MSQLKGLFVLLTTVVLLSACRPGAGKTEDVQTIPFDSQAKQALSGAVMPGFSPAASADLFGLTTYDQWSIGDSGTFLYDATENALKIVTADNATNVDAWQANYISPSVSLQAGHRYQIIVRLKTDIFPRGQNLVIKARSPDGSRNIEVGWNVSKANEWEDVILPAYADIDGVWTVRIWTYPTRYAETPSTIYIDPDLDVFELPFGKEIVPREDIDVDTDKQAFASSTERVDGLGNFYIKASDTWQHVFPKMIYRSGPNYLELFQRYAAFGFNGVMDVWTEEQAQAVLDSGMRFISINSNSGTSTFESMRVYIDRVYNWADSTNHQANILWYNYDNENESVANYDYQQALAAHVDAEHLDPLTGGRRHPIYYLNGQFGLPRTYLNDSRHALDITGSYVGTGGVGESSAGLIKPSLAVQFATQNQRAPATVIQLQIDLEEGFIPSLFYGISMGGRALSMWRDGTTHGGVDPDFRNAYWAQAFKDEVSPRIDQMLPLIEQPQWTPWLAETDHFPDVRVGTRDYNGDGYLILSNFTGEDQQVQVTLQGDIFIEARDFFSDVHVADVSAGQFTTSIGHFNHGYQVLKLLRQQQPLPDAGLADTSANDLGQQGDATSQDDAATGNSLAFVSVESNNLSENSAIIHFVLNQNAQGQVEYGTDINYGLWNVKEESFNYSDHSQPLINLSPATTYHYRVHAWDPQAHEVISADYSFTTLGAVDGGLVDSSIAQDAYSADSADMDAGQVDSGSLIDAHIDDAEVTADAGSSDLSHSLDGQLADASAHGDRALTSDAGANQADQGHQVATLNPESGCNCASHSAGDRAAGLWLALIAGLAMVSRRYTARR